MALVGGIREPLLTCSSNEKSENWHLLLRASAEILTIVIQKFHWMNFVQMSVVGDLWQQNS